jgi:hypothetical protein
MRKFAIPLAIMPIVPGGADLEYGKQTRSTRLAAALVFLRENGAPDGEDSRVAQNNASVRSGADFRPDSVRAYFITSARGGWNVRNPAGWGLPPDSALRAKAQ